MEDLLPKEVKPESSAKPSGPFRSYPGENIVAGFKKHIAETGKPHEWAHHSHTKPPKDLPFVHLWHFSIPEKIARNVGMAPCPICSPKSPKYLHGVLAWFPSEGLIRAIGHDCAEEHIGAQLARQADADFRRKQAITASEDYLLEALPRVSSLRGEVGSMLQVARDIDQFKRAFWKRTTKAAAMQVARLAEKGPLVVTVREEVQAVDRFGKHKTEHQERVVASYSVLGMELFRKEQTLAVLVAADLDSLSKFHADDENEALELITNELGSLQDLAATERLLRQTTADVERLRLMIGQAKSFVRSANLQALAAWTGDARAAAPFLLKYDPRWPARLSIRRHGRTYDMTIPKTLLS